MPWGSFAKAAYATLFRGSVCPPLHRAHPSFLMREPYIPYGQYWSTPFARWQGAFAHLHPLRFGAQVAREELARRGVDLRAIDYGVLGTTVPSASSFFGLPWVTGMMGAMHLGGPTVNQACATSARILQMACQQVADGS